ncbi:hypothetical protein COV58_00235, partial [Candidatus Roizmanbacteria bacterium CG11_big_fil_rev_8_21_14_0_20_36_8]
MPLSWREKFDVIVSNYARCYFTHPNIALLNAVQALSVGGWAHIDFDVTNNPIASKHQNWDDLYERTWGVYFDLCKLRDEGFIEFDLPRKPGKLPL